VPRFGELDDRRKCHLRSCSERRNGTPYCDAHWDLVPEDLQIRVRWAYEDGTATDRYAALRAADEYVKD